MIYTSTIRVIQYRTQNIKIAQSENLPVNVWTVNKEKDMLRMIDYGVDGIITDYPLKLKKLCEKENISWF